MDEQKLLIECQNLSSKIEVHSGTNALGKINAISSMYYIYFNNFKEFKKHLGSFCSEESALTLRDKKFADQQILEASRLQHNLLAGIKSLVENERWLIKKWYSGHVFEGKHKKKIDELFISPEIPKFLEEFRNYFLHQSFPPCAFQVIRESNIIFSRFVIYRDDLLSSGWKWSGKSKQFIKNQSDEFEIIEIFKQYHLSILKFYHWLEISIKDIHKNEINEVRRMTAELKGMYRTLGYDV
tara:strand:+ start:177 stop:896 length:720 start_codon:yes stop_codon:yes gene_type:complete